MVHLILEDGGSLTAKGSDSDAAGIEVSSGHSLTIYGQTEGTGTVTATGGQNAAGIGGGANGDGGAVTIHGGTVNASGSGGAGIGGGSGDPGDITDGGNITITGGTVTATSSTGAGIGGGLIGNSGDITITGGKVTASGQGGGAGIGAAAGDTKVGTIAITGGDVTASGGDDGGAGIGGSFNSYAGDGGITIGGTATVSAKGGEAAAGIGGGAAGYAPKITIEGGTVTAIGGDGGSQRGGAGTGIGDGYGYGGDPLATAVNITITGGTVDATGGTARDEIAGAAGIGGGSNGSDGGSGGTITIEGGTVTATGGKNAAGIGGGGRSGDIYTGGDGGDITIEGGTVYATGGENAAGIGAGGGGADGSFAATGNAFIVATSIGDRSGQETNWRGVIFQDGIVEDKDHDGRVYGSSITLTTDATVPAGKTLYIDDGKTLIIAKETTITGKETAQIHIADGGTLIQRGTVNCTITYGPDGTHLYRESATTVIFQKDGLDLSENTATQGDTIVIVATAQQAVQLDSIRTRRAAVGTVDFWLGEIGESGRKLNDAPISITSSDPQVTASLTLTGLAWAPSEHTVYADFGGFGGDMYLMDSTASAKLTVKASKDSGGGTGGGGGDGGGGGGGGSTTPKNPSTVTNLPTNTNTKVNGKTDQTGTTTVNIPDKKITDAINSAKNKGGQNGISVTLKVSGTEKSNSVVTALSANALKSLVKAGAKSLTIECAPLTVMLDLASMKTLLQTGGAVKLTATKQDTQKLPPAARAVLGNRPAYQLSATADGKMVSQFGGQIHIAIPYTPAAGEIPGNLHGVYIDNTGTVTWLIHSSFDRNARMLRFTTTHFSMFGIGSKAAPVFTDIANHWAKDSIHFVTARGLLGGTGSGIFSPDAAMTQGAFATALGKLGGNVSSPTPNVPLAREAMAVMFVDYAKATDFIVPKTRAELKFADAASIGTHARSAVKTMQMAGVLSGKDNLRFDPKASATRAEVAAALRRYMELMLDPATAQGLDVNNSGSTILYENGKLIKSQSRKIDGKTYQFNANGEAD